MADGLTTVNFGAFPGAADAEVTVSGQTGILSGSLGEAWVVAKDSADHSADEHMVEQIQAHFDHSSIVAGTSFKIKVFAKEARPESIMVPEENTLIATAAAQPGTVRTQAFRNIGGLTPRLYGVWNIGWAGNWTN